VVIKSCRTGYKTSKFCKLLKMEFGYNNKESYFILSDILASNEVALETSEPSRIQKSLNEFGFNAVVIED
jgi:hypothetical protein